MRALPRPHSLLLPVQDRTDSPFLLTMPYVLFDEWLIVERPFDILGLARIVSKNSA